ncbi:hypothetical protein NPIL_606281 [Nephila pilipes]|uniref:Uncharacterized protein n=1 Tax=Nephila pilipes TaxID=299642 RepID=A0A8X6QLT2_NEPPI|nr:hypothetical protein NPIL_606281 [Nephila pilipes]
MNNVLGAALANEENTNLSINTEKAAALWRFLLSNSGFCSLFLSDLHGSEFFFCSFYRRISLIGIPVLCLTSYFMLRTEFTSDFDDENVLRRFRREKELFP